MRRIELEVTDVNEILKIIDNCEVCRVGMIDEVYPYIVPMNYGYSYIDEKLTFYFHCGKNGRKIDILRNNSNVCFELDCDHHKVVSDIACENSYNFSCVMGEGTMEIIEDFDEKLAYLDYIMKNHSEMKEFIYKKEYVDRINILKLSVNKFSCKVK